MKPKRLVQAVVTIPFILTAIGLVSTFYSSSVDPPMPTLMEFTTATSTVTVTPSLTITDTPQPTWTSIASPTITNTAIPTRTPQPTITAPPPTPPPRQPVPGNCATAVAMGLTAQEAAQYPRLDRDKDGVACYGD